MPFEEYEVVADKVSTDVRGLKEAEMKVKAQPFQDKVFTLKHL